MQDKIYREIWLFQRRRVPPIDIVDGSQLAISLELMDYTVPAGATAKAFARPWAAETTYEQTATVDGNTVTFTPPDGFFRPGGNSLQIEINGNKIPLSIDVNCGTRLSDGGDGATPEAVRPLVERAEEAAQKAEDALAAVPGAVQAAAQPLVSQAQSAAGAASASAASAASSAESVKASAEQIEANREAIETITPDDTAIDGKPWTSKKIVDVLCPPIEETGNPVQCYPVTGYPLDVTASWEPVQEGEGEPSPGNIRPIVGRDSVTVERCGENYLDPRKVNHDTYNPYGLTIQYVEDNKVHLQGTYSGAGNASFVIMDTNQSLLAGRGLKIYGLVVDGKAKPFSLYGLRTANETVIAMQAIDWKPGDAVEMTIAIVVTNSTTAPTAYTPYIGQTNTLTMPETVYGGSVNAETGEGQKEWALIASYAGEQLPGKWISDRDAYAAGRTPTIGAQVVYKLAAPIPFVATGNQQIPALSGVNTVLTDADTLTVRARENRTQAWQEIEALGDQIDALTTRLKSGKLADAELHLGFYLDDNGDLCQKED